ncbi:TPA: hypothetical protein N0F65_000088 [Lagenidium giganteum]|uniref:Crinkler effector protein N-terminal domain-containing protein n=1 Tax=Lagenidium giganteum TaxID=4803 RepID=A0AAV2YNP5_9STRA|nr:TPA: hypothetical protein N0F65_000088 [Lagenidium giganteum]
MAVGLAIDSAPIAPHQASADIAKIVEPLNDTDDTLADQLRSKVEIADVRVGFFTNYTASISEETEVKLRCGVYDEGSVFSVEIKRNADVEVLQEKIFEKKRYSERYQFAASDLTLYLASGTYSTSFKNTQLTWLFTTVTRSTVPCPWALTFIPTATLVFHVHFSISSKATKLSLSDAM